MKRAIEIKLKRGAKKMIKLSCIESPTKLKGFTPAKPELYTLLYNNKFTDFYFAKEPCLIRGQRIYFN